MSLVLLFSVADIVAKHAQFAILVGYQKRRILRRMGSVTADAVQRLSRPRIGGFVTHRMEVRLGSILVTGRTKLDNVRIFEQILILAGMRLMARSAVFERRRMFDTAGEFRGVVAGQAGFHAIVLLERLAETDMRAVAFHAAIGSRRGWMDDGHFK